MAEIVRINASNHVGIVRATYTNNETGEELVEVQIAGRATGPRSFVRRADVTEVSKDSLSLDVVYSILRVVSEIERSVENDCDAVVIETLGRIRWQLAMLEEHSQ